MRKVLTFLFLLAMAFALNAMIKQCSAKRGAGLLAQKQERADDVATVDGFFKPDTASDIRFGHPQTAPTP